MTQCRWMVGVASLAAACGTNTRLDSPSPTDSVDIPSPNATVELPDSLTCSVEPRWRHEQIPFPPEFAPMLGPGREDLFFSEGMFDSSSPSYWSYVFSISLTDSTPTNATALKRFFRSYYAGLLSLVGKSKSLSIDSAKIQITAFNMEAQPASKYLAELEVALFDTFSDGRPLTVRLTVVINNNNDTGCMNVAASPAQRGAPIWRRLQAARSCLPCPL